MMVRLSRLQKAAVNPRARSHLPCRTRRRQKHLRKFWTQLEQCGVEDCPTCFGALQRDSIHVLQIANCSDNIEPVSKSPCKLGFHCYSQLLRVLVSRLPKPHSEVQKGRGFSAPGGLQHQIRHRDKPTMLVGADTMVQSNVNTFMSNFTGDRNLGSKVICPVCPRYDIALPVDNNDAQFNQRMLVPPEDRHIFAFNSTPARDHPGKDHVAAGIGQTRCHGCVWVVGRYSPSSCGGTLAPWDE